MTKSKRIVLLVVDIVTLLSAVAALTVSIVFICCRSGMSFSQPSHQEIYSASLQALRTDLNLAVDDVSFLSGGMDDLAGLLLFIGVVMLVGSICHFLIAPWRLNGERK